VAPVYVVVIRFAVLVENKIAGRKIKLEPKTESANSIVEARESTTALQRCQGYFAQRVNILS
jgi:hypothetical protein